MRPEVLFPLFAPITALQGIGPRLAKLFESLAGPHVVDLCWHLPSGLIDRRYAPKLSEAEPGRIATLTLTVGAHRAAHNPRQPYRVPCHDETGSIELVFFHARGDYLAKVLPEGQVRVVSGKLERFQDRLQMTHPDHIGSPEDQAAMQTVEPVYPLTAGLSLKVVGKAVRAAVERAPALEEWNDPALAAREGWAGWHESLTTAHAPSGFADLEPTTAARRRLAYDELLANQLALALVRAHQRRQKGRAVAGDGRLRERVLAALPYDLTGSQTQAVAEIVADMAEPALPTTMMAVSTGPSSRIRVRATAAPRRPSDPNLTRV